MISSSSSGIAFSSSKFEFCVSEFHCVQAFCKVEIFAFFLTLASKTLDWFRVKREEMFQSFHCNTRLVLWFVVWGSVAGHPSWQNHCSVASQAATPASHCGPAPAARAMCIFFGARLRRAPFALFSPWGCACGTRILPSFFPWGRACGARHFLPFLRVLCVSFQAQCLALC